MKILQESCKHNKKTITFTLRAEGFYARHPSHGEPALFAPLDSFDALRSGKKLLTYRVQFRDVVVVSVMHICVDGLAIILDLVLRRRLCGAKARHGAKVAVELLNASHHHLSEELHACHHTTRDRHAQTCSARSRRQPLSTGRRPFSLWWRKKYCCVLDR